MSIARATEAVNELVGALEGARKLIPRDFEPRDVVMVANTEPAKPKGPHRALGRRDLSQF